MSKLSKVFIFQGMYILIKNMLTCLYEKTKEVQNCIF